MIYDSNKKDAKLIGIESDTKRHQAIRCCSVTLLSVFQRFSLVMFLFFVWIVLCRYLISERLFNTLAPDEKRYWHSHHYEVESGMLVAPGLPEMAERKVAQEVAGSQ